MHSHIHKIDFGFSRRNRTKTLPVIKSLNYKRLKNRRLYPNKTISFFALIYFIATPIDYQSILSILSFYYLLKEERMCSLKNWHFLITP